jgi:hypothetical protein
MRVWFLLFAATMLAAGVFHSPDAHGATQSFPVGSVITVTDEGITVSYDEDSGESSAASVFVGDTSPVVDDTLYCSDLDAVTECDPLTNLDDIYAVGGEVAYWTPRGGVLSLPFTTGSMQRTGLFQMTSGERKRDQFSDLIFHSWFSTEPNGEPIRGVNCEYWSNRVQQNHYWTQEMRYEGEVCRLPDDSTVYYNARLECHPQFYAGCSPELYSVDRYQFDLAKRAVRR